MADLSKGWICVYRSLLDNPIWLDRPFSRGQAWIDLLLMANHEDRSQVYQGEVVTFKKGTVNRSILSLAERWGWDRKKVKKFLVLLESEKMATTKSTTHGTTITLEKWGFFQDIGSTNGTTKGTTTPQPLPNHSPQTTMITMNNNDNKEREKPSPPRHKHGVYKNVLLTDSDLEKLKTEFPSDWSDRIDRLSEYMETSGRSYKNHLATIRAWAKRDSRKGGDNHEDSKQREEYSAFDNLFSG